MEVSVIIVNYNGGDLLAECVKSVLASTSNIEIILADNNSTDGSVEKLIETVGNHHAQIKIVRNNKNLGFAKANNVALEEANGKFLLFLNPDCLVQPDTIEKMTGHIASWDDVGMAGCLIVNEDGSEQRGCRRDAPTPIRSLYRVLLLNKIFPGNEKFRGFDHTGEPLPDKPFEIEAISGAFMFVKREVLEKVGELDEEYFMHCEDLDFCYRVREAGCKIIFCPDVSVVHHQGTCSVNRPIFVLWHKAKGMSRYYDKFLKDENSLFLMWIVKISIWARFTFLAILKLPDALVSLVREDTFADHNA